MCLEGGLLVVGGEREFSLLLAASLSHEGQVSPTRELTTRFEANSLDLSISILTRGMSLTLSFDRVYLYTSLRSYSSLFESIQIEIDRKRDGRKWSEDLRSRGGFRSETGWSPPMLFQP